MFNNIATQAANLVNLTKKISANSKTKILTITSGKGGVGKSTMTANIAFLMAQKGKKIGVLDADIGLANMQVLFDIKPKLTFFDYIDGKCSLAECQIKTQYKNVTLIPGKSGYKYSNSTDHITFSNLINEIKELNIYDILIIDTGAGLNEYVNEFLNLSDFIVAITSTDPSALTDVYALIKMLNNTQNTLYLCFNHTNKFSIGKMITQSIIKLAQKNRLNEDFMIKYIGNLSSCNNISTTGRLRKLFVNEFIANSTTFELEAIVDNLLKEIE